MNSGGDSGRDDYGLPPVDVEVPDDARELDRDVQAYHRELRSQRRRILARKLYGPLTRDGMVLPLLAGCLALTLLAATLLTVFTVGQGVDGGPLATPTVPRSGSAAPIIGSGTAIIPRPGSQARQLPDVVVMSGGVGKSLRALIGPVLVLALVPQRCRCFGDLRQLTIQAKKAGATVYLLGTGGNNVDRLPRRLRLPTQALDDTKNALPNSYYGPRLMAVLVGRDGSVADILSDHGHGYGYRIGHAVKKLVSAHVGGPSSPTAPAPAPTTTAPAPATTSPTAAS